jgi:hypothetical protein
MTSGPAIRICAILEPFRSAKSRSTAALFMMSRTAAKRVIVESVIKLGTALGIQSVAEGIETEAERAIMRAMGCPIGQGYFFARPMEARAFRRLHDEGLIYPEQWDASLSVTIAEFQRRARERRTITTRDPSEIGNAISRDGIVTTICRFQDGACPR